MPILCYFDIFYICCPFLFILNQKKNSKFQKYFVEYLKNLKNWVKNADFSLFFLPKMNCMVKMTTPYPSPYCTLSFCKMLGKNNEPFFR